MKTKAYIAPQIKVVKIKVENLLNAISNPNRTNVDGLGVSGDDYEGEGHSRRGRFSKWEDDYYEE